MKFQRHTLKNQEDLFLFGWFFILAYYLIIAGTRLIYILPGSSYIKWGMVGISLFLWILKLFRDKYKPKVLLILNLLIIIMVIAAIKSGKEVLLITTIFIIAAKGINVKEFIRFDLKIRLFAILFIALLALLKIIPNIIVDIGGIEKHAFGWQSPNTMASNVIIVLLEFIYLKWDKLRKRDWILVGLVVLFLNAYVAARTSILAFVTVTLWTLLVRRKKRSSLFRKKLGYIYGSVYLFCAVSSYLLLYIYNKHTIISTQLDRIFTHRLYFSTYYITRYGFSLLGQKIDLTSTTTAQLTGANYSGVDMAYVLMPIQYGIIYSIGFIAIFSYISYKLYKLEKYPELMMLIFFAMGGITSNVMILFYRNFTIIFVWVIYEHIKNNNQGKILTG